MKTSNRILSIVTAVAMVAMVCATPYKAYAFSEDAISLNIDTSTVEVKNAWAQIKNAAIIHLIAQKMQVCISIGQVISEDDDTVWPQRTVTDLTGLVTIMSGVLDKGNVFKTGVLLSGDVNQNIGVGTWLSGIFGEDDGTIKCNASTGNGNLFDMFVYIYKNYKTGITADDLGDASVTEADRLKVVCNKDDLTKPGLLQPSNMFGTPNNKACNANNVEWYTGVTIDKQLAYIKSLYEEMRANSNNDYIVAWDDLEYYNGVDGYYLYSNDFETQCGSASFSSREGSESGYIYKPGFRIKNDGTVKSGYYEIQASSDTARTSFVKNDQAGTTRTCQALVDEMNEHIGDYLRYVNHEVYNVCKTGIEEAMSEKRKEINEKYIDNEKSSERELEDANAVLHEYNRIQLNHEYVMTTDGDNKTLIQVPNESQSAMPTDYIWTCRSHLPYIDVTVQEEVDIKDAIEDEFTDYCYQTMDLAWVVCPIIKGVSNAVDSLSKMIEEFF